MRAISRQMASGGLAALLLMLVLAGCTGTDGSATATSGAAEEPATTAPTEDTAAPESGGDTTPTDAPEPSPEQETPAEGTDAAEEAAQPEPGEVPAWAWVVALLVLVAAVVWMTSRSGAGSQDDEAGPA
jgi:hypothetical protein